MKTFDEANEALRKFWPDLLSRKHVYTLETITRLLDYVGNPQDKLKVVHVAGTSGKTSTTYYAAALLQAAGKKVGLTVSPHVDEINERVQINMVPLAEDVFCGELTEFMKLVTKSGVDASYFEILVAFAYWEFVRQGMEYAAVEVGLGGLVDGTNVITRRDKVCVITDIGLDHINILGTTLGEIAEHKAGIIQLHNGVFCYQQDQSVMDQINARAKQKQADLHVLGPDAVLSDMKSLPLFQQRNLGLARQAVNYALHQQGEPELTDEMVAQAAKTYIPARMEEVQYKGKTIIIDGAHNGQKLHALSESVRSKYPGQSIAAVVSFVSQRSYRLEDSAEELTALLDHVIITSFKSAQDGPHGSVDAEELRQIFTAHGAKSIEVAPDPAAALQLLLARPEPILMIAGSFYLLNHIRPLLFTKQS